MIRLYKLLFLILFCCSTSLHSMADIIRQTPLPGAPIRQTSAIETIIRDPLCGGWIIPSLIAASVVALSVEWESPCNLRCVAGRSVGIFWITFSVILKMLGFSFEVENRNPTSSALSWRNGMRVLYGLLSMYVMLNGQYLAEKYIF